jgi:response regulator RpfG family c-di-GMP phosphodiesterase
MLGMTGFSDKRQEMLEERVHYFLEKPFSSKEFILVIENLLSLREVYEELETANSIIQALSKSVEARDSYLKRHSARIAKYSSKRNRSHKWRLQRIY